MFAQTKGFLREEAGAVRRLKEYACKMRFAENLLLS